MTLADLVWGTIGFLLTLMIFSYLLGDNPAFRLATYIFVGVTAGFVSVTVIYQVIIPQLVLPLMDGTLNERLIAAVPLVLSILLLLKIFPPVAHLGNIPMAYLVGAGAAIMIGGAVLGTIFPQVTCIINLFDLNTASSNPNGPGYQLLIGIFIVVGFLSTLMYFYFGARQKPNQPPVRSPFVEKMSQIGQIFIGITLGSLFTGVYSSAFTALIDRVNSVWNFIHALLG